jgi:quercetin dioxygenase-like cupin family protein
MREIRTFELEDGEPAAAWRVAQPLVLKVMAGEIWLTLDGDPEDYWLAAGDTFELPRGARAWVSAGQGAARLALAFAGCRQQVRTMATSASRLFWRDWLPRWLTAA